MIKEKSEEKTSVAFYFDISIGKEYYWFTIPSLVFKCLLRKAFICSKVFYGDITTSDMPQKIAPHLFAWTQEWPAQQSSYSAYVMLFESIETNTAEWLHKTLSKKKPASYLGFTRSVKCDRFCEVLRTKLPGTFFITGRLLYHLNDIFWGFGDSDYHFDEMLTKAGFDSIENATIPPSAGEVKFLIS